MNGDLDGKPEIWLNSGMFAVFQGKGEYVPRPGARRLPISWGCDDIWAGQHWQEFYLCLSHTSHQIPSWMNPCACSKALTLKNEYQYNIVYNIFIRQKTDHDGDMWRGGIQPISRRCLQEAHIRMHAHTWIQSQWMSIVVLVVVMVIRFSWDDPSIISNNFLRRAFSFHPT
jgi:hypothetical protein